MRTEVTFSGTADDAGRLLGVLPLILAGTHPDPYGLARLVQLRAANALLSQIRQDFIRKSRGVTGRDGIQWQPLKPETIAYSRRTTRTERKSLGIRAKGSRRSLSPEQDRRWREVFASVMRQTRFSSLSDKEAQAKAGAIAWATVKKEGAHTLLELLGSRKVDILRDTGELLRSFSPGVDDKPSGADGQVIEIPPGRIVVGSNKKPWHHTGDPKRGLPARPFWPADGSIPDAWMPAVERAIMNGIAAVVAYLLSGVKTNPRDAT